MNFLTSAEPQIDKTKNSIQNIFNGMHAFNITSPRVVHEARFTMVVLLANENIFCPIIAAFQIMSKLETNQLNYTLPALLP